MRESGTARPTVMREAAAVVAVVFGVVGIAGFIPGITTGYGDMTFAGHDSGAELFGVFDVSVLHNLIHLAFAVAGLLLARTVAGARAYLIGGGVVYLVVAMYGALVDRASNANVVPVDNADDWLHFALGVGMIGLGLALAQRDRIEPPA
ncbi:MAG: DUF4383 domain-containing protein [Nocardioidaceae bacterium]|nr:DUF4383 domain-containing protein [Nocardioidaceae bacterium]